MHRGPIHQTSPAGEAPAALPDLPAWIARQVMTTDDSAAVISGMGRSLVEAGVRVRLLGFATKSLSVVHRGVTLSWEPGSQVDMRFTPHGLGDPERSPMDVALGSGRRFVRWDLARGDGYAEAPVLERLRGQGCTEYLIDVVDFPPGTALRGVGLFYATDRRGGFTDAEVAALSRLRDAYSLAVFRFALSYALTGLLDAYVGSRAASLVLNGHVRRGEGKLMSAAILVADLKGFTAVADREDSRGLVRWLDEHLDALGREVGRHGGEIFKFTGDGFIAAFPVDDATALPCAACTGALAAARSGLALNRGLEASRRAAGEPWLAADLALHFGQVVSGNIGTADRLDFTAIGRAVNEASRIEALCDATGRNLLVSDSFARRCVADLVDLGDFRLRGVAAPRRLWTVAEA